MLAVGVRPNTKLLQDAGAQVQGGIVTDEACRTALPDVYAAGDCARSHDITTDEDRVLALLPNAYMQGECAGINMAGGSALYDKAIPMNAIGFWPARHHCRKLRRAGAHRSGQEYAEL